MFPIFICDNNHLYRKQLEQIIKSYLSIEENNLKIELSTANPKEILNYIQKNRHNYGVYFLDVELNHRISGIDLAVQIRKRVPDAKIIFVTTQHDKIALTFKHKIEALDYIPKNNTLSLQQSIYNCLYLANEYCTLKSKTNNSHIQIKEKHQLKFFLLSDVIFFETSITPHKIQLHLINKSIDLSKTLNEIETLSESLIRIHRSYVVNKEKITGINYQTKEIILINDIICPISARKVKQVSTILNK